MCLFWSIAERQGVISIMNLIAENRIGSPFVTPVAVEAWDTWFRWRENGTLRDDTVDATWRRVASTLASVEPEVERGAFELRLFDTLATWRLLLDERLLATAGTGKESWPDDDLAATLNIVGFVRESGTPEAKVDLAALKDCAELATHALDNAILFRAGAKQQPKNLRIGIIGFAEALALLGLDYNGVEACRQAQSIAQSLAEGCLRASIALAEVRGTSVCCDEAWIEKAYLRRLPADLIERAERHGLRHVSLTSISPRPRLAKFANDTSDAVLPLIAGGALLTHRGSWQDVLLAAPVAAQLEIRGAMQPWIDEPISCPVLAPGRPMPASHLDWYARTKKLGLGALSWSG